MTTHNRTPHLHILGIGQSNLASHGTGKANCDFGTVHHAGTALPMADPIAGGTGREGSIWPRFAAGLAAQNTPSDFSLSLLAQGGTAVADWAVGGKCHTLLQDALPAIQAVQPPVNLIVWHQGERDTLLKTTQDAYVDHFKTLYDDLGQVFPDAHWLICRASMRMVETNPQVIAAQTHIATHFDKCHAGPDTDTFGEALRRDGTHFNRDGLDAFAAALLDTYLSAHI